MTYLAITQDKDGRFKFVAAEGVNEDGPIFTFGDTNMRTRFACGARNSATAGARPAPPTTWPPRPAATSTRF